jgi:polyisoprenoid-binding protein YceI
MKNMKNNFLKRAVYLMMGVLIIGLSAFAAMSSWKVKEGYEVKFAGGKIEGKFEELKADIVFDKAHPEEAKISATINVNSLSTGFFLKNSHAKEALDADKYPTITFVATSVTKSAGGYQAAGKLTMKGVTKPVTIHFTFTEQGSGGIFKGNFKVVPKEFNITKNGSPDELTIDLSVPVTKS